MTGQSDAPLYQVEDPDDPVPFASTIPIVLEEGADTEQVAAEAAEAEE